MTIKSDVAKVARKWRIDPRLLQAIDIAEGNIILAMKTNPPPKTREEALDIACRTIVHRMMDYISLDDEHARAFVSYLGSIWAPIGVDNDPTNLNKNWVPNVLKLWRING